MGGEAQPLADTSVTERRPALLGHRSCATASSGADQKNPEAVRAKSAVRKTGRVDPSRDRQSQGRARRTDCCGVSGHVSYTVRTFLPTTVFRDASIGLQ